MVVGFLMWGSLGMYLPCSYCAFKGRNQQITHPSMLLLHHLDFILFIKSCKLCRQPLFLCTHSLQHTQTRLFCHTTLYFQILMGNYERGGGGGLGQLMRNICSCSSTIVCQMPTPSPPKSLFSRYTSLANFWTALSHMSLSKWAKGGEQGLYNLVFSSVS